MDIEFKISKKPVVYDKAIRFLEKKVKKVKNGGREFVWILEHPTTFTAGIRFSEGDILDKSILIKRTNRGGKITLHNPGQKVVYFAINLNKILMTLVVMPMKFSVIYLRPVAATQQ